MRKTKARRAAMTVARFLAGVFALTTLFVNVLAQSSTGQIVGKITDPNGAVISGATVTVKSVDTAREVTAVSDDQGGYIVTSLQPGLYDLTVQSGNFKL